MSFLTPPRAATCPGLELCLILNDGLELTGVAECVLDDHAAELLLVVIFPVVEDHLLAVVEGGGGRGEVDVAVTGGPAALAGEVDDGALGVEEQQGLGAGQRERGVGALAAAGDLGADLRG